MKNKEFHESADKRIDADEINELRTSIGWVPRSAEKWEDILAKSSFVYSFWDRGRLAGMGRLLEDGVTGVLYDITVHRNYQGKGLGNRIMERIISEARNRKCSSLVLFMDEQNEEFLVRFYEKSGFERSKTGMKCRLA